MLHVWDLILFSNEMNILQTNAIHIYVILDKANDFTVPDTLVDIFSLIWVIQWSSACIWKNRSFGFFYIGYLW